MKSGHYGGREEEGKAQEVRGEEERARKKIRQGVEEEKNMRLEKDKLGG